MVAERKYKKLILLLLCIGNCYAGSTITQPAVSSSQFNFSFPTIFTLSLGPAWAQSGKTQHLFLQPVIEKTYVADNQTRLLGEGELFLAWQRQGWVPAQIGLALACASKSKLTGIVWDDGDSRFDNFSYAYRIRHEHIAIKAKLLGSDWQLANPYIEASAGVGFNRASNFFNKPLIYEALQVPNFGSHTKAAFTYTFGVGLQRAITPCTQIGIGYKLTNWGGSQLAAAPGQTLNSGLKLQHLYTNGLIGNITYLA